jgi:hypothetical protein
MKHWLCFAVDSSTVPPMNSRILPLLPAALLALGGCATVKVEPIEVKPIHITVDVNVKVDKALDDFFGDLDKKSTTLATRPGKS